MAISVRVSRQASEQIVAIVDHIARDAPAAARRWRKLLLRDIASLRHFPQRHGIAPEAEDAGVQVHQMMHGLYRVLYTIDGDIVNVHVVRHGTRRLLRPDELPS